MPLADSKQDQLKAEVSAKQAELDKVNAALKEAQSNKENAEAIKSQHSGNDPFETTGNSHWLFCSSVFSFSKS